MRVLLVIFVFMLFGCSGSYVSRDEFSIRTDDAIGKTRAFGIIYTECRSLRNISMEKLSSRSVAKLNGVVELYMGRMFDLYSKSSEGGMTKSEFVDLSKDVFEGSVGGRVFTFDKRSKDEYSGGYSGCVLSYLTDSDFRDFERSVWSELNTEYVAYNPSPRYPLRAKSRKIEGHCKFKFDITELGETEGIEVVDCPNKMFFYNSEAALKQWIYKPKLENGVPVRVSGLEYDFVFKIKK